ncbi:hypothetical protein [Candidatus Thiodictyon syntrophicum]|uniref:Flippase-like domain-containing protein n=1 Tax=Candidatus Thiodictyon syntrophicum TaxID=1166950 RepID=A0A2K8UF13_9GAMM|nr:hypothetical protein [Candidatus Thiodictyon syntrophicum]AUB84158.1 hypothetical protein THSYN_26610 [Candidatus Thiodictyon syntrophicum]
MKTYLAGARLRNLAERARPARRLASRLFTPLALIALLWAIWHGRQTLATLVVDARLDLLAASLSIWLGLHLVSPLFTLRTLRGWGQPLRYRDALCIHVVRLPAKYLPGGIWHSVARAADYRRLAVNHRVIAAYLLIETLTLAGVTLFLGGAGVFATGVVTGAWAIATGLCAVLGVCVLLAAPWVSQTLFITIEPKLSLRQYLINAAVLAVYWGWAGMAFALFLNAFPALRLAASNVEAAVIYVFSWGIGFVTLFAPQGIGVSELVASHLLGERDSVVTLAALLAGFRVVILAADVAAWLLATLPHTCGRPASGVASQPPPRES